MIHSSWKPYANMHTGSKPCRQIDNQFEKVPVEIVKFIFPFLVNSDQICFALSCKGIYAIYSSVLRRKDPNSTPKFDYHLKSAIALVEIDLRIRLQNKRWIYCIQCPNPHWLSLARTVQSYLGFDRNNPWYCPRYQIWHRPPFTGQVDICPCFTMTFCTHQLFSYLCRNPAFANKAIPGKFEKNPNIGCDETFVNSIHECLFDKHPLVGVRITSNVWFDGTSETLQVINRFKFDISKAGSSHLGPFGRTSSNRCIHQDTKRWLEDFFHRCKSNFHLNTREHSSCLWLGWDTPSTFEVLLHRDLGGSKWPDKRWKSHCYE